MNQPHDGPARTVVERFARTLAAHAHRTAIEIPGAETPKAERRARAAWTYAELDRAAEAVAAIVSEHLEARRARGADRPDEGAIVALALPRTDPRLFAAMLGAMRAGCAYAAIDPAFPAMQAAQILRDADALLLVAEHARAVEIAAAGATAALLSPGEIDARMSAGHAPGARSHAPDPDALAYLIYTSGTTGRPKGVEIAHASIANLVEGDLAEFALGPDDRVVQGSSASYDSSIEELWLAWAAGATAVVMDDATARLGPDLLPWLVRERVTVLCPPPTLLRTLACDDPQRELPRIRLLYVGGEALPEDVADLWSRGRRLENGYGPTECTVTCLRGTVRAGEPITIGTAVPGSFAAVVDPESPGFPVVSGDARGELVVGGASLARGYRGQAETTAERFIEHASLGRVYRTGDLVHRDARGNFHYHGRIDAQVKLRGYRIELGAVEAAIAAHPSVLEAACTVEGEGARRVLVAHAVARDGREIDAGALRAFVSERLPAYMVPAEIAAIPALPRSVGGKLDRRRLPALAASQQARRGADRAFAAPEGELERRVAGAISHALGRADDAAPIGAEDDFFDDLGLDSLSIAIAISRLRQTSDTRAATVRLAYEHRTVRAGAQALGARADDPRAEREARPRCARPPADGTPRPIAFTLGQTAFLAALLVAAAQVAWIPSAGVFIGGHLERAGVGEWWRLVALAAVGAALVVGYGASTLALGIVAKWTLVGRYRPQRMRAFTGWHLRHWTTVRLVSLAPWSVFETLGIAPFALRLLGARVGRRVHIHRGVRLSDGGWDLLTLEDDATVGQDACLRMVELEAGALVVDRVTVRRGATLETRAGLSPGAELGEESVLRALSNLGAGERHDRAILDGVPARRVADAPPVPERTAETPFALRLLAAGALFLAVTVALALPWFAAYRLAGLDLSIHEMLFAPESIVPRLDGCVRLLAATIAAGVGTVLVQAALVRMLGGAPEGRFSLRSNAALALSMQSALVEGAGKWLSGTIMWPMWLNLAGARIGPGCEISTVTDVVPSTVRIGRGTFFADGIYLGGPTLRAGTATIGRVELGPSCFIGNHAVLPGGTRLARGTLVGISTRGDGLPDEPDRSWFGHPSFRLPRREIVEMPRALTHEPPLVRRVNRWCWELARFALPIGPLFVGLAWFRAMEVFAAEVDALAFRLVVLPLGVLSALALLAYSIVAMKWLLVGRVRPGTHALWSCWCSRWDFLYVAWGMWAAVPLAFLDGTLLLVGYLRLMGCRIGRRALLGSGFSHVVDPDMLRFGDDVTVQALFQAHTFEDRVLKIDHVRIKDGATVGANTVVLYGADIGEGARVEPHSVVMKRETLVPRTVYEGAPTQPVGAAD